MLFGCEGFGREGEKEEGEGFSWKGVKVEVLVNQKQT